MLWRKAAVQQSARIMPTPLLPHPHCLATSAAAPSHDNVLTFSKLLHYGPMYLHWIQRIHVTVSYVLCWPATKADLQ